MWPFPGNKHQLRDPFAPWCHGCAGLCRSSGSGRDIDPHASGHNLLDSGGDLFAKLLGRLYKTSPRKKRGEEGMNSMAPDTSAQEPSPMNTTGAQGWRRWILPLYTAAFAAGVGMHILGSPNPEKGLEGLSHALIPFLSGTHGPLWGEQEDPGVREAMRGWKGGVPGGFADNPLSGGGAGGCGHV